MLVFLIGMAFGAVLSWAVGVVIIVLYLDDDKPIVYLDTDSVDMI